MLALPSGWLLSHSKSFAARKPSNNQPYFRMTRLDDGTPVHGGGRAAFDYMLTLIRELKALQSDDGALGALRAFIGVRTSYQPRYGESSGSTKITPEGLTVAIQEFVQADSEHGKRAQAIVAGLLDIFASPARVESGRINDPSRRYPVDVCVSSEADAEAWDMAFEVRDKPVAVSDVQIFGKKCVDMQVLEAAVVMVNDGLRYRLHVLGLPGSPDIVFTKRQVVVFCDGDFWHGRDLNRRLAKLATGHNATYWLAKVQRNVERDRRQTGALEALGWTVLRFWETDILCRADYVADQIIAVIR
jgi:DNA mismatch endonuclease Vsr